MRENKLKKIPNCLPKYRRQKGLTQKEVARILGLKTGSIISKWERGFSFPSTPSLLKLSALYGRQVEALFIDLFQKVKEEVFSEALNNNRHE